MSATAAGISSPLLAPALSGGDTSPFLWRSGAILAFAGMLTGALGTHGLKRRAGITAADLHAWETASTYAIVNGLGLMLVSMHRRFSTHRFAGLAILTGGVMFSSSIMVLVLQRYRLFGPITPLGGLIMMAG
ncbi:DUF423-domain-containing protein [Boletus edulis BED1]|uniref:DUF423-domain-containing protein n=1 Tax=Boletus edulis BED1 TaxID=1328754 RepID=A0AAD4C1Z1_BOLED|nr:DUF423-domain-containing protein [Boletus edulis BED1]